MSMKYRIPFNKPFMVGKELYYVAQSVLTGHTAGNGEFSRKCEALLQAEFEADNVLLTTSCTSALELAALLCDVKKGDEVILPSYTFVSTANAFFLRGAKLRFVDIRPDTLNIDETLIEREITERTKVIVPVHYAGVGCEMEAIKRIADKHRLSIVEDAAQSVNAKYKGSYLGTLGDLGAYSFHETKNFICGEGGALICNDRSLVDRAEVLREKGTNRSKFFRGEVDKYTWVDIGSSYVPSDILAAFLYAQLENMTEITNRRRQLYEQYHERLSPLAETGLITVPSIPEACESNYHMYYILLHDLETRDALIKHLKNKGILAVFHYVPLHTSPVGEGLGYRDGMLPVTESVANRIVRLPFYHELGEKEISEVVGAISEFFGGAERSMVLG